MNVLLLRPDYATRSSGTSERIFQIVNCLAEKGVAVFYSTMFKSQSEMTGFHENVQLIKLPRALDLVHIPEWITKIMSNAYIRQKYDIVQIESFSFLRILSFYILLRPFGKKFVIVFHDKCWQADPRKNFLGRIQVFYQRLLLSLFDASIVPGQSLRTWFETLHGKSLCKKMIAIPNGVPMFQISTNSNHSSVRTKYGIDPGAFVALFFGSMEFRPNYESATILYNMSEVLSKQFKTRTGRDLVFVLAGKNSKTLPKKEYYAPIGFVDQLEELLSLPDVIVIPHSTSYSGPHVKTIYSFISGKPIVATEDAVKDMPGVMQGKHFLLFSINDPVTLLNVLINICQNQDLRECLAKNALEYSRKFTWQYTASLHSELYHKLLNTTENGNQ